MHCKNPRDITEEQTYQNDEGNLWFVLIGVTVRLGREWTDATYAPSLLELPALLWPIIVLPNGGNLYLTDGTEKLHITT